MKDNSKQNKIFPTCMQGFRLGGGSQPVSNFPSSVSKFIIKEMFNQWMELYGKFPKDTYVIICSSTGWGGRLVGALGTYTDLRNQYKAITGRELTIIYITTDPHKKVSYRFKILVEDWFKVIEPNADKQYFKFHKAILGSETPAFYKFCRKIMDQYEVSGGQLSLTSPPYFNREKYGGIGCEGQSHENYKEYELWRDGFLRGSIRNISKLLLPEGRFYLNIANLKEGKLIHPLESDSLKFSEQSGLNCIKTYKMLLSSSGKGSINQVIVNEKPRKFEPIFVLEKQ